ncbi:hypothetical protein RND71_002179 [Anisodus tanguticus]|uniref:R3H domain-containing protein n=1 Tax=Anisodus tanguticus TaxID=243964 RepID=A0AAE1VSV0_9SOLA|nr:hypothetical protein RND71_002179 [Anisodus tanguticus]
MPEMGDMVFILARMAYLEADYAAKHEASMAEMELIRNNVYEHLWRSDRNVLELRVQHPFQRLLLHGVCEFYNLVSLTTSETEGSKAVKTTRIKKKKKKAGSTDLPNITPRSKCVFKPVLEIARLKNRSLDRGGHGELLPRHWNLC